MSNCGPGMIYENGGCIQMKTGGQLKRKKQAGGYLQGPSHEQGGIPANIQNGDQVELEGGEYIINAQTVNAVGTEFLDELNSTATTYHQGGYQPGQLPNPSNYQQGGMIQQDNQVNFQRRRRPFRRQKMRPGRPHREMGGMVQQDDNLDWKRRHRRRKRDKSRPPTKYRKMGGEVVDDLDWKRRHNRRKSRRPGGETRRGKQMGGPIIAEENDSLQGIFDGRGKKRRHRRRRRPKQYGGAVGGGMNNPITQTNLQAQQGQFVYQHNSQPYMGPYHIHQDGTYMIGAGKMGVNHEIKPNEVIIRNSNNINYQQGGGVPQGNSQWVYFGTDISYTGHVIQVGNTWFTTVGGGIEANRKQVEKRK
tara:strand:+ start:1039 stop:2124 length:1086 start_codon:yes stop_codon:yes gene_type:complete